MDKLSLRVQALIDNLVKRVSSMEETPENCAIYTSSIEELYILFNTVKRMEDNSPDNYAYFEKTGLFVLRVEKELYKDHKFLNDDNSSAESM